MKPNDILLERWAEVLARKGDLPAIFDTAGNVIRTFRQIEDEATMHAKSPANKPSHQVRMIQAGNHADWPSLFLASLRTQRIALPIDESASHRQINGAVSVASKSTTTDWGDQLPVLFKLTSGTTATPRMIRFRSEQLLADCDQICDTMGITDADLNFGVIAVSHSYGFSNLITPLIARGLPVVMSRDRTPRAVLDDLARTSATVFPGMPVFYQAFCEIEKIPTLPKLRLCISAGAPLPLTVAKKFRQRFGLPIHSFYGASECGGICYDRDGSLDIEGYVGTPMNGVEVEMIDSGASSSQVRVRSAAAGDGYFPEADEEKLGNNIFIPDDLLARCGIGFRIVSRLTDIINVAGRKVNPVEIEDVLLRVPGVRQAVAFGRAAATGLRNQEIAACVAGSSDVDDALLLDACRKSLSPWQVPKRIFIVDTIPVNERGKISRKELAKRFG